MIARPPPVGMLGALASALSVVVAPERLTMNRREHAGHSAGRSALACVSKPVTVDCDNPSVRVEGSEGGCGSGPRGQRETEDLAGPVVVVEYGRVSQSARVSAPGFATPFRQHGRLKCAVSAFHQSYDCLPVFTGGAALRDQLLGHGATPSVCEDPSTIFRACSLLQHTATGPAGLVRHEAF